MKFFFVFCLCFLLFCPLTVEGAPLSYRYLLSLAKRHLAENNYSRALRYFQMAQMVNPEAKEPANYINLIQRKPSPEDLPSEKPAKEDGRRKKISRFLDSFAKERTKAEDLKYSTAAKPPKRKEESSFSGTPRELFKLDTVSAGDFPVELKLFLGDFIRVKADSIQMVIPAQEGVVSIKRLSGSEVDIKAVKFGSVFVYVWAGGKRRDFHLQVIPAAATRRAEYEWEEAEGFSFEYNSDWSGYYRGDRLDQMERQTVSFNQWLGVRGPTPYGDFDAFVSWAKLNEAKEVTGYTVGLEEAKIGPWEGVNFRAFDFTKVFSDLSFPGLTLKGFMVESPLFRNLLSYSIIYGREKDYFLSAFSPSVSDQTDSYIEGLRLSLFPEGKNTIYFNYARGYGRDRDSFLKDKVFSLETEHHLNPLKIYSEFAYDQDRAAMQLNSQLRLERLNLSLSFRNIEEDFMTITSNPPNRGEIGAVASIDWFPSSDFSLQSSLNVYRDRFLPNPGNPQALNYEWDGFFELNLGKRSHLSSRIYYVNAPGVVSPHRDLNATSTYNKFFDLDLPFLRSVAYRLGYNYQRSRNPLSPSSNYQKKAVLSGIRLTLMPDVTYYTNITYSWLTEESSGLESQPWVVETGIDLYRQISPSLSTRARLYYRNEEKAESLHSFLAGQDSLEGSLNFTFAPDDDIELFCDGRLRNVWADASDTESFIEADVRFGAKIWWDSFFRWNPASVIKGQVFDDGNGDGLFSPSEEGLKGITVVIGPKKVVTGKDGKYKTTVRAKQVAVGVDSKSVPAGYVFTTPSKETIDISRSGAYEVNFGLSSQAGIYGAVFWDQNNNNSLDKEDKPVQARLVLEPGAETKTNDAGVYFFNELTPGKYKLRLDINSLPAGYIPTVPFQTVIQVEEAVTKTHHFPLKKE